MTKHINKVSGLSRRELLVGSAAGAGLVIGYSVLPNALNLSSVKFSTNTLIVLFSNFLFIRVWFSDNKFWINSNLFIEIFLSIKSKPSAFVPGLGLKINE